MEFIFSLLIFFGFVSGFLQLRAKDKIIKNLQKELGDTVLDIPRQIKEAREDSLKKSRMVINAHIVEEMAPMIEGFPYNGRDCQHFGSPYDYVCINGMSEVRDSGKGDIKEIVFIDIKTGNASLTPVERKIKECVQAGRVRWETLRYLEGVGLEVVPEEEPKKKIKKASEIALEKLDKEFPAE